MTKRKIEVLDVTSSTEVDWLRVHAEGLKTHYVHKRLLAQLIADLENRGSRVYEQVPTNYARFELPSYICIVDRPEESVRLDLLNIIVPSRDVALTVDILIMLPQRTFANGEKYFKLKCEQCCIVFTEEQHEVFTAELMMLSDHANERDKEFMETALKGKKGMP